LTELLRPADCGSIHVRAWESMCHLLLQDLCNIFYLSLLAWNRT